MSEVNQIVQLLQSRALSKHTAITLFRSFLVVDKNVKLFTIFFLYLNKSWYKVKRIEKNYGGWLFFEYLGDLLNIYKRIIAFIKFL